MQKVFSIVAESQWGKDSTILDLFRLGVHKCNFCSVVIIIVFGVGFRIGFITVEEEL